MVLLLVCHGLCVCGLLLLWWYTQVGSKGGVSGGVAERGDWDSYCEIPMEGNWNSIGVRSWLLP